jgi:hypothetical protein
MPAPFYEHCGESITWAVGQMLAFRVQRFHDVGASNVSSESSMIVPICFHLNRVEAFAGALQGCVRRGRVLKQQWGLRKLAMHIKHDSDDVFEVRTPTSLTQRLRQGTGCGPCHCIVVRMSVSQARRHPPPFSHGSSEHVVVRHAWPPSKVL